MADPTEEQLAIQAKRLFPHIREHLHTDDELAIFAKKLKPHSDDLKAQEIGDFVLGEAKGLLKKALWLLGVGLLAFLAWIADVFRWAGK